ncbi:MAG: hypothetical protein A2527_08230 [Candidatus Lambdaproteobacteria bacterium RIFOXYD2_FULL_50_16]|uniref:Zinc permease n=1 Tax=Candidatus Lambdaproteobacteria bacterium RIFOXYD2_FULL_50_16 TaxID=1817772 RepID=A0A1F6GAN8_9PROT|nr:MAG: hypothetical protein A2527_08230 [Candidatus Lambdaproteobacteria bacterium RIFOXYD2_FULL_50_16]
MEFQDHLGWGLLFCLLSGSFSLVGAVLLFKARFNLVGYTWVVGFSSGALVYTALAVLLIEAQAGLIGFLGENPGRWAAGLGFFLGLFSMVLLDRLVPSGQNPHQARNLTDPMSFTPTRRQGIFMVLSMGGHSFPEGIALLVSTLFDPWLGLALAIALGLHNLAEGATLSRPLQAATGSSDQTLVLIGLTGLAEVIGAVLAYFVLIHYLPASVLGFMLALSSGFLVFVAFDSLLSASQLPQNRRIMLYATLSGFAAFGIIQFF